MDTKSKDIIEHRPESKFVIQERISYGVFGQVFKVFDNHNGKYCAMKFILKSENVSYRIFLLRELTILKQFPNNRHLLQMIGYYETDRHCCIQMPLMNGSLEYFMKRKRMSMYNIRIVIIHILLGLHDLHSNGYTHTDVKPQNILIGPAKNTKGFVAMLCDFNWTMKLNDIFKAPKQLQSLPYRAPEVLFGDEHYGQKIDLWSVGILLLEMIVDGFFFNPPDDIKSNECIEAKVSQAFQICSFFGQPDEQQIIDNGDKHQWKQYIYLTTHEYAKMSIHNSEKMFRNNPRRPMREILIALFQFTKGVENDKTMLKLLQEHGDIVFIEDKNLLDFLDKITQFNPNKRMSAMDALTHPFLREFMLKQ